jgi:hypothetical protein
MLNPREMEMVAKLVTVLRQLPPPPGRALVKPEEAKITCACHKQVCLSQVETFSTNFVSQGTSNVCRGCTAPEARNADQGKARLVCVGCGQLAVRVPPHLNKDVNRRFLAGQTYHILGCPACPAELRARINSIFETGISEEDAAKNDVAFSSPIFEVLYLKNPHHALLCLAKLLSPSPSAPAVPSSTTP